MPLDQVVVIKFTILKLISLKEVLQNYLPLEKKNKIDKIKNIYKLSFQRSRGKYVLNYLYNNATIYLDRKEVRYKEYCRLY